MSHNRESSTHNSVLPIHIKQSIGSINKTFFISYVALGVKCNLLDVVIYNRFNEQLNDSEQRKTVV